MPRKSIKKKREGGGGGGATRQGNVREEKKMYRYKWAFLSIKKKFIPTQFSLYFKKKNFWWARGENT